MSLAVPYLLDAAADVAPRAEVRLPAMTITVADLGHASARVAESFLSHGWAPGDRMRLPDLAKAHGLVAALGAVRVGVRLAEEDNGPTAHEPVTEREVAESEVFSETVLAELGGRVVTHGDVVNAVPVPDPLVPLVWLVHQVFEHGVGRAG